MEYVILSNGVKMPMLGYGVYQIQPSECECCVLEALHSGYRLLDTAQSYFNEEQVGNAIRKSGIPRSEIFLTTKVWIEHYGYEATKECVLESMRKLQTDYLDLVLLHQPFSDYYGAYRTLEDLYDEGKLRAIGVSNFYPDRLVDLASFSRIRPMVNQVEIHPHHQQTKAKEWMDKYHVQAEAWAPFGEGRGGIFGDSKLLEIGQKYKKTPAQVILRWHLQRGIVVIPKSTHLERMQENFNVFDFELSSEDMKAISEMDQEKSSFFSHQDPGTVEWFVKMVEERRTSSNV
ncbi:aldo/keto reductase [uncultured Ruthenibacterium sp.]|uniref:aldo/keto reductase n=1 Tax=uncultured Ruthenibacterium sp. TaxID=1905347 RepID=UPI00349E8363